MKKLKSIPKEELELMGYDDIAYLILEETKKKMKINDLFREICNILELGDNIFESHIADFFEMLEIYYAKRWLLGLACSSQRKSCY